MNDIFWPNCSFSAVFPFLHLAERLKVEIRPRSDFQSAYIRSVSIVGFNLWFLSALLLQINERRGSFEPLLENIRLKTSAVLTVIKQWFKRVWSKNGPEAEPQYPLISRFQRKMWWIMCFLYFGACRLSGSSKMSWLSCSGFPALDWCPRMWLLLRINKISRD